jgi:hypothetical protein
VLGHQHRAQYLARADEVVEIGFGPAGDRRFGVERVLVLGEFGVADVDRAVPGERLAEIGREPAPARAEPEAREERPRREEQPASKRERAERPPRRERTPEPEVEAEDEGWNGPVPSFLGQGFGS